MGLEPMIPVLEPTKMGHALESAATVIGSLSHTTVFALASSVQQSKLYSIIIVALIDFFSRLLQSFYFGAGVRKNPIYFVSTLELLNWPPYVNITGV
jgi:hypothetical protein